MSVWIQLFIEFFKTGLFALGGGLATIPFLHDMIETFGWFNEETLMNMIAVAESTPGPIGVNMATYVGYITTLSPLGGIVTTLGLITPSIIIIIIVAQFLKKFKESQLVQSAFYGLRPAVCAMIASAGLGIFLTTMLTSQNFSISELFGSIRWISLAIFALLVILTNRRKNIHPIVLIIGCAVLGIVLKL